MNRHRHQSPLACLASITLIFCVSHQSTADARYSDMSGLPMPSIPGLSSRPAGTILSPERVLLTTTAAASSSSHSPSNKSSVSTNPNAKLALQKSDLEDKALTALQSVSTLPKSMMKASLAHEELNKSIKATLSNTDYALDRTMSNIDKMGAMIQEVNENMRDMENGFRSNVAKTLELLKI